MFVMASTGLMIWFKAQWENTFPAGGSMLPSPFTFTRRLLATLAIIVWHWYGSS